jgi:aminotransferase
VSIQSPAETRSLTSKLNKKLLAMPPSGIRRFFDLVIGMDDVVSLGVGEPDFVTPDCVREKAAHDLAAGHTTYTSNSGLLALRQELATWLQKKYSVNYDPATEMLITVGASEAIDIALRAIINPGDEVIVLQPCYVSYAPSVELAGGIPVLFATYQKDGFRANLEELQKVVTSRTKAIMLNYPSNPCGNTFDREDLEKLADFIKANDLLVLSDEIYAELTYDKQHVSLGSLPGMKEHTILINGFSKSHAMTGWRLGYSCAPAEITAAMTKIHQYTILCAPTLSQYAAIEALQCGERAVTEMRAEYKKRRDLIVSGFNTLGFKTLMPEGAFYAFADITSTGMSSEDFCMTLLAEEKVAVVPGTAFGECGEGFIRASYASSLHKIETALHKMESFLNRRR